MLITFLLSFLISRSAGGGGRSSRLHVFQLLEGKTSFQSNRSNVLESVDDHMRNGEGVGLSDFQGDGSDLVSMRSEFIANIIGAHVEDFRSEDGTIIEDVLDFHTVSEGLNIQLLQEDSFGVTNLLSSGTDLEFLGNFNLSLLDLGGDVKGMEERDLRGIQTSGTGRNSDIDRSNHTDFSSGRLLVRFDDGLKFEDGSVGEDKTNLAPKKTDQFINLVDFSPL